MLSEQPTIAYIGIGSNLGNRAAYINKALSLLDKSASIKITKISSIIETPPLGGPENQGDYLNAVAQLQSRLSPLQLLILMQNIETRLDRTRSEKWAARTIDLDLLLFGSEIIEHKNPDLSVPHPLMHQRLFVMEPLAQIAPELIHPKLNLTMKDILDSLQN